MYMRKNRSHLSHGFLQSHIFHSSTVRILFVPQKYKTNVISFALNWVQNFSCHLITSTTKSIYHNDKFSLCCSERFTFFSSNSCNSSFENCYWFFFPSVLLFFLCNWNNALLGNVIPFVSRWRFFSPFRFYKFNRLGWAILYAVCQTLRCLHLLWNFLVSNSLFISTNLKRAFDNIAFR